jgi:UDP-N-acetylglucosamine/UDP-N-acetylgalactosamine diphosphorylase
MMASKSMEWIKQASEKFSNSINGTTTETSQEQEIEQELNKRKDIIYTKYELYDQQHVLDHWSELTISEKVSLIDQLESIPVNEISNYVRIAKAESNTTTAPAFYDLSIETTKSKNKTKNNKTIKPFSGKVTSTSKDGKYLKKTCYKLGMDAIKSNKVATVLLAGGQGTRLGYDGPKGMYDIGLPSKRSLFCLVAERILKLTQLAKVTSTNESSSSTGGGGDDADDDTTLSPVRIPLYIMTSPMNHQMTEEYFVTNNYFGLPSDDVKFFSQGTLPCLTTENGKIIMENKYTCSMAPDGNGGIYPAMEKFGILDDMQDRGIEHIHAFAIDNALVKPADPVFIGYCIDEKADCGNKVLWKSDPHEKVGVIAERDGKPCVIEYSELSLDMAEQTKGMIGRKKKLLYGAGNICNHYYSRSFMEEKVIPNQGKMYHIANKKIPFWDESKGETVTPSENNGMKLESFIFDVFPLSENMAILEVERDAEFAPVKNAPGSATDSPDVAVEMLSNLAKRWLEDAGASLNVSEEGKGQHCEIAPLMSYGGEGLEEYRKKEFDCPFTIDFNLEDA